MDSMFTSAASPKASSGYGARGRTEAVKAWWMQCALRSDGYEWWPSESGIYLYLDTGNKTELDFLDLRTSCIPRTCTFDKPDEWGGGLSPDGKWLLYSQIDETAEPPI